MNHGVYASTPVEIRIIDHDGAFAKKSAADASPLYPQSPPPYMPVDIDDADSEKARESSSQVSLRLFLVQLMLLLAFIVLTLNHFKFVGLFATNCYQVQMHNIPYCIVVDFILSIVVVLVAIGLFLHKRTWVVTSAAEVGKKVWLDYESAYGAVLALFVIAVVAVYAYYMAQIAENFRGRIDRSPCHQPPEKINGYVSLAKHISDVMEKYELDYFMDYGTLIGAMRFNGPIPWDHDVDFGLLEASMTEHDVTASDIVNELERRGFATYHDIWNGLIRVKTADGIADADLMLWREDMFGNGIMKRVGLEAWVAPLAYSIFNDFPKAAVIPEPGKKLPRRMFAGMMLREPQDAVAFLATRYRSSWWKEVRPSHCLNEKYTVYGGSRPPYLPFQDDEHVRLAVAAQHAEEEAHNGKNAAVEMHRIILHNML